MNKIQANARSVKELLSNQKYQIDYYQREYRWEQKHVFEMIDDLVGTFLEDYHPDHERSQIDSYGRYFLGSIIISQRDNQSYVVDGQQRLTTISLLLIYLRQQTSEIAGATNVSGLIYSERLGKKSFNLQVDEREPALTALFNGQDPTEHLKSESVQNLVARYEDIVERFPTVSLERSEEDEASESKAEVERRGLDDRAVVFFLDWLIENTYLVEIVTTSDNDAYTIFETMNDRGLSLTPTDMLKGHILANITNDQKRINANQLWRKHVAHLNRNEREGSADFFKAWLRGQYGRSIRTGSGRVQDHDYDRLGSEFHRWVRDESALIGLHTSEDYFRFITSNMDFFAAQYNLIVEASSKPLQGLEHVRYNAFRGFTLQAMIVLAPLRVGDSEACVRLKIRLVAMYLDILLAWREWNGRRIAQSSMKVPIFNAMKEIRDCTDPACLAGELVKLLSQEEETFDSNDRLRLNKQNRKTIHRILARITAYVESGSHGELSFEDLMSDRRKNRFQVEHIWANKHERHSDEFPHRADFEEYRDRLGDLVLLPSDFNQSYGALPYSSKLPHYVKQNLLVRSLTPVAYEHEPGFSQFMARTGLQFQSHPDFRKQDVDMRQELYKDIAKQIWNPDRILDEAKV